MSAVLYTPDVLALATGLAAWPWDETLPLQASARSRSCGSALRVGLALDADARIVALGLRPQACAIGQAAAAIFAGGAIGRDARDVGTALDAMEGWLAGGALPAWPMLATIATARDYPGRHGAILLPWRAARDAMRA